MEKRIVTFGLLSLAIMLGFMQLQLLLFGRPEPAPAPDAIALGKKNPGEKFPGGADRNLADALNTPAENGESGNESNGSETELQPVDAARAGTDETDTDTSSTLTPTEIADTTNSPAANTATDNDQIPQRRVTLGSLDVASKYRMLVTFTSTGAAIERVELTNPRYTDLNDDSGYLGHLAGTNAPIGGVWIGIVGPGTPAALATSAGESGGLQGPSFTVDADGTATMTQLGDRIIAINDTTITNDDELQRALARTRPGDTVNVVVQRQNGDDDDRRLTFSATLGKRPLEVIRPDPLNPDEVTAHPLSFLTTLARVGDRAIAIGDDEIKGLPSLHNSDWSTDVDEANGAVEFSRRLSTAELAAIGATGSLEIVKRYSLVPSTGETEDKDATGYLIDLNIAIRNTGDAPQLLAYQLDGPTGLPIEGWWYSTKTHATKWGAAGARDVIWRTAGKKRYMVSCNEITKQAMTDPENPQSLLIDSNEPVPMHFVGCDAQYFAAVLIPRPLATANPDDSQSNLFLDAAVAQPVGALDEERKKRTDVTFRVQCTPQTIAPGESLTQDLAIFAGPKERNVLDQFGIGECIVYGWFGSVSQPLVWFLHLIYKIIGNYGIAIILLTVTVRGAMFPLGRKMALNAQKMQELGPEMKKIADKYKNDMEKRSKAQRELFAKHNYNPMAGCFMMFFQLPVFLGLYRGLSTDIQLRQAHLFERIPFLENISWCTNLAGPDKFLDWSSWMPLALSAKTGWLGPYMNILPFVTCILFMLHQKLFTPPPTDEQQKMQQSIMKVMMLFMGVMFHKVAAGLCVYFIASSLWGLAERLLLPKPKLATAGGGSIGESGGGGGSSGGFFGFGGSTPSGSSGNGAKRVTNGQANVIRKRKAKKKR